MKQRNSSFRLVPIILIVCLIIMSIFSIGCGKIDPAAETLPESTQSAMPAVDSPPEDSTDDTMEQSDELVAAPENAKYTVTFNATWSAETHPDFYVSNAHFSPFVAYSHNGSPESYVFDTGSEASQGMEEMADTGKTVLLESEIKSGVTSGSILEWVKGQVFDSPGINQANLNFTQSHSQVTFVSMIAPSPDWFVAVQANLFDGVNWSEEIVLELISYDAGTDSGTDLISIDVDTNPRELISVFPEFLQHLGTVTLTLNSSDS